MTERSLLNLPNRIVRFAEEIERVNSSPLLGDLIRTADASDFLMHLCRRKSKCLDRMREVFPKVPDWESAFHYSNQDFFRLPNLLRAYATICLEPNLSNLRKNLYKLSGHKFSTIWLLEFVNACTGNYFYAEIARLLNVAFREAGMPKVDEDEFDSSTLCAAKTRRGRPGADSRNAGRANKQRLSVASSAQTSLQRRRTERGL